MSGPRLVVKERAAISLEHDQWIVARDGVRRLNLLIFAVSELTHAAHLLAAHGAPNGARLILEAIKEAMNAMGVAGEMASRALAGDGEVR